MRTWVLSFLLAVMSIQSAWASFAVYCQHQADVVTEHVGHHEHQHRAAAKANAEGTSEAGPAAPDASLGSLDNDCGFCHLGCAQPLSGAAEPWFGQPAHTFATKAQMRYATREPEGVERPNWQRLARPASLEEPFTD